MNRNKVKLTNRGKFNLVFSLPLIPLLIASIFVDSVIMMDVIINNFVYILAYLCIGWFIDQKLSMIEKTKNENEKTN